MMEPTEQGLTTGFDRRNVDLLRKQVSVALSTFTYECVLHPLGFYLIRLAIRGDTSFRLHYWPASHREKGSAVTPYHDHVWGLSSCVLAGEVENVLLELEPDDSGEYEIADIHQIGNVDEVIPASSRVKKRIQSRATYRAGQFYEIPPRVFHYTSVQTGEAALTVVRAIVLVEGGPRTLLPVGSDGHTPSREPVDGCDHVFAEIKKLL